MEPVSGSQEPYPVLVYFMSPLSCLQISTTPGRCDSYWLLHKPKGLECCRSSFYVFGIHGLKVSFIPDFVAKSHDPLFHDPRFEEFIIPSLYDFIPWLFPAVWGVADNTKRQQKQRGFYSVLLAMTRDPAEFGWHCWSNTTHPPPSSTT